MSESKSDVESYVSEDIILSWVLNSKNSFAMLCTEASGQTCSLVMKPSNLYDQCQSSFVALFPSKHISFYAGVASNLSKSPVS